MLVNKYQPLTIESFIGLDKAKAILNTLLSEPGSKAILLYGESGIGKTAMGQAIARKLGAEVRNGTFIHVPARKCNLDAVSEVVARTAYPPLYGVWYVVLVDEIDTMTPAAQDAWLSVLDATEMPARTVFVFTCNEGPKSNGYIPENLSARFLSRLLKVPFSNYGLNGEGSRFLARVWDAENGGAEPPDFARIMKDSRNNLRAGLMAIETVLLERKAGQ